MTQDPAPFDDAAVTRAQDVVTAKGLKIDTATVREMLDAAVEKEPADPETPVSLGMIDAGRKLWLAQPSASVHVLLPALYRVMDAVRVMEADEAAKVVLSAVEQS